jgi:agmatine/peptidylarginine deiminase
MRSLLSVYITALLASLALSGCAEERELGGEGSVSAFELELPASELSAERGLTAYQSAEETAYAKQDRFDTRGNYREIYGETAPAQGPLRAVAEFEPTEGVLIAWDWQLTDYLFELIALSASRAPVWVITESLETSELLSEAFKSVGVSSAQLRFFEFSHEGVWTRDFGPLTVVDELGLPAFVDVIYYPQRRRDDAVPTLMARHFKLPVYRPQLEIEGGNFMSDGAGRCFFSSRVLEVNAALDTNELSELLYAYLGCERSLVLEPLYGEGTGHIDMFAKLLGPNTMLLGAYSERDDPMNAYLLERNAERIERFAADQGWPLEIVRVPMPRPRWGGVYPSYTNSLIINELVIVPIYPTQDGYEGAALEAYQRALPSGYELVTIDADEVIEMGGAVHCTTMSFNVSEGVVPPAERLDR